MRHGESEGPPYPVPEDTVTMTDDRITNELAALLQDLRSMSGRPETDSARVEWTTRKRDLLARLGRTKATMADATFEDWAQRYNFPLDFERIADVRTMFDLEVMGKELEPTVVPDCPSWCAGKPGHRYDSVDYPNRDGCAALRTRDVTFVRLHTVGSTQAGTIIQEERNRGGVVILGPIGLDVWESADNLTPAQVRARAADLLRLADRLDEIMAAATT